MKLLLSESVPLALTCFSTLKRVVVSEAVWSLPMVAARPSFSTLKRVVVSEAHFAEGMGVPETGFSTLKRVVVSEAPASVILSPCAKMFQYPQAGRRE